MILIIPSDATLYFTRYIDLPSGKRLIWTGEHLNPAE